MHTLLLTLVVLAAVLATPASAATPDPQQRRNGVARLPRNGDKSVATVPRLFRKIQDAINRHVAQLDVTYGRRGVPKSIYIDSSGMIADEEVGYSITHFHDAEIAAR